MLRLKKIAVTGGLSSGKSEVCRIFGKHGAYLISADEIGHQILANDLDAIKQLQNIFGPDVLSDGKIDRKKLAEKVFGDEGSLREIERILHPRITKKIQETASRRREPFVVVEIPLLFETGAEGTYDTTVAVISAEPRCRERSLKKGFDYQKRMQHQLSQEEKATKADFVIENNGSIEDLEPQVKKVIDSIN